MEASNDARLRRYVPRSPLPRAASDVAPYLLWLRQLAAEGRRLSWCVADRRTDEALGDVALFDLEPDGSAQLGYWAHPKARGGSPSRPGSRTWHGAGARAGRGRLRGLGGL